MRFIVMLALLLLALGGGGFIWLQRGVLAPDSTMADATPEERAVALSAAGSPPAPAEATRPGVEGGVSPAPPALSGGSAFVINSAGASIDLIDVATRKLVRRIPVLREPHHMALTPDHRFLIIGDMSTPERKCIGAHEVRCERRRRRAHSPDVPLAVTPAV